MTGDSNDVVYLRIEYLEGVNATVFRGKDIKSLETHFNVEAGQTFTMVN